MGDMWRSQKMQLVQMIVQNDAAHAIVNKLGQTGIVEFRDVRALWIRGPRWSHWAYSSRALCLDAAPHPSHSAVARHTSSISPLCPADHPAAELPARPIS